jgi:hypothetical protein
MIDWISEKYKQAMRTLDFVGARQRSYSMALNAPAAKLMLADLAKFCRATVPPAGKTTEETWRLIGRNEVWCRMMEHIHLGPREMYKLYGGPSLDHILNAEQEQENE